MSRDMVYEEVPRLPRRTGDNLIAGANNATILLGRDRLGGVESGYGSQGNAGGKSAGAIHAIVGRSGADPSIADDAATLYLSAKNDPDVAASTSEIGSPSQGVSAAILRADCVRIVPRTDIKVSVGSAYLLIDSSGAVTIEGTGISLGFGALPAAVLGTPYRAAEAAANSLISPALIGIGAALAAIVAGLGAFPATAVTSVPVAAGPVAAAVALIAPAAAAITTLEANALQYLSKTTKIR